MTVVLSGRDRDVLVRVAPRGEPVALDAGTTHAGLTYLSLAAQSLAVEARLLAAPVSFELTSTSHAEGIELRGHRPGRGTARAVAAVRRHVPFLSMDDQVPSIDDLTAAVRGGEIARAALDSVGAVGDAAKRGNGDDDRP